MSLLRGHGGQGSATILSILVVVRMLPNTLFGMVGGLLADRYDRRRNMIVLDVLGGIVALAYLLYSDSIVWILLCTGLQEVLHGLYEPNRSAILPDLLLSSSTTTVTTTTTVMDENGKNKTRSRCGDNNGHDHHDDEQLPVIVSPYLSKANTVTVAIWSTAAAVGSSLGGFVVQRYGPTTCFVIDGIFYLLSALILQCGVDNNKNVTKTAAPANDVTSATAAKSTKQPLPSHGGSNSTSAAVASTTNIITTVWSMLLELVDYLRSSPLATAMVLFKSSGAILFGASDVLQVSFATIVNTSSRDDSIVDDEEEVLDSQRLGWLFAAVGIGCLIGPLVVPEPRQHIPTIIGGLTVLSVGFGLLAACPPQRYFWLTCFFTALRASGTAVMWVDSTIIVQEATPSQMLGRVSAVDLALAVSMEAASAVLAGRLLDHGWSAHRIAGLLSIIGLTVALSWYLWWRTYEQPRHLLLLRTSNNVKHNDGVAGLDDMEMEPLRRENND
jgi:MFS family permease